jgi:nucleoside-diphosphate-sugar epimerase
MQKILITGASGFVGGFLVEEALKRGLEVYAAVRKSSNLQYLTDDRINFIFIDFEDKESLKEIFLKNNFDLIIHNAGLTKTPKKEQYFKVNATYLENMVEALIESNTVPSKFTFISSLASFGPAEYTADGLVTEDSEPHPITNYGRSKLQAERYLKSKSEINYTIIRPTAVYGPREKDLFTVYDLVNKGIEMTVGLTDQKLTFIYVKDLVRVILDSTLDSKKNVAYFVSDLEIYSSTLYNELIRKALGRKRSLKLRLPVPLVKTLGYIAEKAGKLTGNYPSLNIEKVNELEAKSWNCDSKNLIEDLNFKPNYKLSDGLKESIAWYRKNNWLK